MITQGFGASSTLARNVLHLGAGYGDALEAYLGGAASEITLVEPNPEMLVVLRQRAASHGHVNVVGAAVGSRKGRSPLNVYNFPEVSSMRAATGVLEAFPSLQIVDRPEVDVLPFQALLARHKGGSGGLLVVDAPGEEATVLSAAIAGGDLVRFPFVIVYCGDKPQYEDALDAERIIDLLELQAFDLVDAAPDTLGRLQLHFRRNAKRAAAFAEARRQKESAELRAAQSESILEAARKQLETYRVELTKLEAQLELMRGLIPPASRAE